MWISNTEKYYLVNLFPANPWCFGIPLSLDLGCLCKSHQFWWDSDVRFGIFIEFSCAAQEGAVRGRGRVLAVPGWGLCHGATLPHPRMLNPGVPQVPHTASPSVIAALRAPPLGQLKEVLSPKRATFLWILCFSPQLGWAWQTLETNPASIWRDSLWKKLDFVECRNGLKRALLLL